jgi:hypothetical protein
MSTQFDTRDQQATSHELTGQQATSQQATGTSWIRIWAVVIGTAVVAALVVLAVSLWHGQSSTTPASPGTQTSTSVPAVPSHPTANPAVPASPAAASGTQGHGVSAS